MSEMLSLGAGLNSVALAIILANQGWEGPIVFADTGAEHPDTYCYLEYFERNYLQPRGLQVTRILPGSEYHERSELDLETFCLDRGIIPLLAVRWCSVEWKRTPLENWRQAHGYDIGLQGICASEPHRVRDDPAVSYPLVDLGIHRHQCREIIQEAGLAVPRKSGCFFCPGQALGQWRSLYMDHPELYERACVLEDNAAENRQKHVTLDPHGKYTLRQHLDRRWKGQMQMDLSDWLPCACAL